MSDSKETSFKFVDKRRIDEQGQEKAELSEGKPKPAPEEQKARPEPIESSSPQSRPPITFSLFIQSLAHQAMMGLGLVPWPDSGLVKTELQLARETIDILKILKEKSVNNLSKDEQALIDGMVYQLQVAFVNATQANSSPDSSLIK